MSLPYKDIITSPIFEFLLGDEKKACIIHESVVAKCSQPLKVMMTGPMKEARERCAVLSTVKPETFMLFSQYAYTGDYAVLPSTTLSSSDTRVHDKPCIDTKEHHFDNEIIRTFDPVQPSLLQARNYVKITETAIPGPIDEWHSTMKDWFDLENKTKKGNKKRTRSEPDLLREMRMSAQVEIGARFVDFRDPQKRKVRTPCRSSPPHKNRSAQDEMTGVFLAHAGVYVFGDKYDIRRLRDLASYKLRESLAAFQLYPDRVVDVVALIRYCYGNTLQGDKLRVMVTEYSACVVEHLMAHSEFKLFTQENLQFAADLLSATMGRYK